MKLRLLILLAAALAAAPAAGQTIKSLGYNTTNGFVTYSGTNSLTFTNALQFSTNARAATRTNLGGTSVGNSVFTATNAAAAATAIGLGSTNDVVFDDVQATSFLVGDATNSQIAFEGNSAATTRTNLGLGATNNVTFSNITASGTLSVTANVTMSGVNNTATAQTADSAFSLMTRSLSDVRYLGEMWNASKMAAYNTTNPSVTVFIGEPMVTYTNGQAAGPYMHEFLSAEKYAGKTVRLLAYCRVNSTNGGNVQGAGRVIYLTNTAGGAESNFPLSPGGQVHGQTGVFTNANTDVFPVATSTNQYIIFTNNVGTIPTNARMIVAAFGFNRASTNTTYTNNLYMHAVQLVVE